MGERGARAARCAWGLAAFAAAAAAAAAPCLRVDQLVREAPGLPPGQTITQRVWISDHRIRLDEAGPGRAEPVLRYLLRTDRHPVEAFELLPERRAYRLLEELGNMQQERDFNEAQIYAGAARLPAADRARVLRENHLRENLAREVTLRTEPGQVLQVGARTFECTRVVITENDVTVVDAQVTDQIAHGLDYLRLYRELGAFSAEVLAKLEGVKGFPLRAAIAVVTHRLKTFHMLRIELTGLAEASVDAAFLDIPEGWEKEERPLVVPCRWRLCDRTVEVANPGGRFDYKGRPYYFCSSECRLAFVRELQQIIAQGGTAEQVLQRSTEQRSPAPAAPSPRP